MKYRLIFALLMMFFMGSYAREINLSQKKSTNNTPELVKRKYPHQFVYNGNPLSRLHSATDPDAHVWNDTVWMYCSQDHEIVNGDTYATMD